MSVYFSLVKYNHIDLYSAQTSSSGFRTRRKSVCFVLLSREQVYVVVVANCGLSAGCNVGTPLLVMRVMHVISITSTVRISDRGTASVSGRVRI